MCVNSKGYGIPFESRKYLLFYWKSIRKRNGQGEKEGRKMHPKFKTLIGLWTFLFIITSSIPCIGATITYTYDNLNRLTKVTYDNGVTEEFTYDAAGNRISYEKKVPGTIPPSVTTGTATNMTLHSATLNGTVNPNGLSTTYYFEWGLTTFYGNTTTTQSAGSGLSDAVISASLSGLTSNTLYHYRVVATNSWGTTNGSDMTFTTLADTTPPSLSITSHSNGQHMTTSSITLIGTASDSGKGDNGVQQVTVNGSRASNDTAVGNGTANWSKGVALNPGANTINVITYDNSTNHNSTTVILTIYYDSAQAPTVSTGLATKVTSHSATLNGTVNPNGLSTTYYFEWGTTMAYGNKSPSTPASVGSGWDNVTVSTNLTGMTLNTTYHYRIVATNSSGISNGSDMTFKTSSKAMPWMMLLLGD
jgi:YD repeat-containing protein